MDMARAGGFLRHALIAASLVGTIVSPAAAAGAELVSDPRVQKRNTAFLARHRREFLTEDCAPASAASDEATRRNEKPCKVYAIVLPDSRVGPDCPVNYYATEAYRDGDTQLYVALGTMWLAQKKAPDETGRERPEAPTGASPVVITGPFTVAFPFDRPGAHRVCRPERLSVPGSVAEIFWGEQAEILLRSLARSEARNRAEGGLLGTITEGSGLSPGPDRRHYNSGNIGQWLSTVSCYWLGCNDRRSLHVEVRSRPPGLPILLDGVRAYLTDESFWVAARRLQDIRVRLPTGVLKKLSECREGRGANAVQLFYC